MAAPINLEVGMSSSASSGAQAGQGDVSYAPGFKLKTDQMVIAAILALVAMVIFLKWK